MRAPPVFRALRDDKFVFPTWRQRDRCQDDDIVRTLGGGMNRATGRL